MLRRFQVYTDSKIYIDARTKPSDKPSSPPEDFPFWLKKLRKQIIKNPPRICLNRNLVSVVQKKCVYLLAIRYNITHYTKMKRSLVYRTIPFSYTQVS